MGYSTSNLKYDEFNIPDTNWCTLHYHVTLYTKLHIINYYYFKQELNYCKQIALQLRTQYTEGIYRPKCYTVTLKSRLRVIQRHWKRNHWIDHTRLTISRIIWQWILSWPWNVGLTSLKVIESGTIWKLGYSFLFTFHSNYGRICSHFGDIQRQRMTWPWNLSLGSFRVTENGGIQ